MNPNQPQHESIEVNSPSASSTPEPTAASPLTGTSNPPNGGDVSDVNNPPSEGITWDKAPMSTPSPDAGITWDKPTAAPVKTGLQNAVEGVEGKNDPGWESPVLGGMIGGALKSAASGLGGILDMINAPREGVSQFDPKTFVDAYKNAHPEANPAQMSAIANKAASNPNKAPSPTIQAVSNW